MNTLIVYANPNPKGNTLEIKKMVEKNLKKRKISYEVLDLYNMRYDPVLYYNSLYTVGNNNVSEIDKKIQKKILKAKNLIFIHPLWWNNMPAILKGFFDRVFTKGFGFKYVNKIPIGLLKGKKAVVFVNSGASPLLSKIFQGKNYDNIITKNTLGFCGIKAKAFRTGPGAKPDKKKIARIQKMVRKGLEYLY